MGQQISATPDHPDGIYRLGETVGWSISQAADAQPQKYHYAVKKNDFETIQSGTLEFVCRRLPGSIRAWTSRP